MRRWLTALIALALIGAGVFWLLTLPGKLPAALAEGPPGDAERGAEVFAAAGCASCHIAPETTADAKPVLAGGQRFVSPFGTFIAPNISPDPQAGIGAWSDSEIMNAVMRGVGPQGQHLYPAFPYTTYGRAAPGDIRDLIAYWRTLPASAAPSLPHQLGFPFNIRRGLGLWKLLFLRDDWVLAEAPDPQIERGRYLVEALGHCAECHTPRGLLGQPDYSRWLGGAPNPAGEGRIPNITSAGLSWSAADIAEYLKSGFTPDFDTAGGAMAEVVKNTALLTDNDRAAIAAYLKAVPPVVSEEG